ncbi:hypothetical protein M758_UG213900 [Ceratodon purpureus]|nr:hypothetical protein M758_UG213900 [Ceratodon purpureus]
MQANIRMEKEVHWSSFGFSRRRITSTGLERHKALKDLGGFPRTPNLLLMLCFLIL